jgi:hypothetical protein
LKLKRELCLPSFKRELPLDSGGPRGSRLRKAYSYIMAMFGATV